MNVLVVDDQKDVLEGIVAGVNWDRLGVHRVFTGCNATAAKEIISNEMIHILLCDIEMPGENGLVLFQWVKTHYSDIEGIFLTSHADFDYAKEAIRLGSFDYILQPAEYKDVEEAILRVMSRILKNSALCKIGEYWNDHEREILENSIYQYLYMNSGDYHKIIRFLQLRGDMVDAETLFIPVLLHIPRWKIHLTQWDDKLLKYTIGNILSELFSRIQVRYILIKTHDNCFLVLLFTEAKQQLDWLKIREEFLQFLEFFNNYLDQIAIYLGKTVYLEYMADEVYSLRKMKRNNVILQSNVFIAHKGMEGQQETMVAAEEFIKWRELLEKGYTHLVKNEIQEFLTGIIEKKQMNIKVLLAFHQKFTRMLMMAAENRHMEFMDFFMNEEEFEQYNGSYDNIDGLLVWIKKLLPQFKTTGSTEQNIDDSAVTQTIEYIKKNIDKNVTRGQLAEQVHLNSEYLSRLFKKETGMMLKDYIVSEKMKTAKHLLLTTNLSVSIIASKVGYSNFSNFTQIFKKTEGVTPGDFRNQHKNSHKSDN